MKVRSAGKMFAIFEVRNRYFSREMCQKHFKDNMTVEKNGQIKKRKNLNLPERCKLNVRLDNHCNGQESGWFWGILIIGVQNIEYWMIIP